MDCLPRFVGRFCHASKFLAVKNDNALFMDFFPMFYILVMFRVMGSFAPLFFTGHADIRRYRFSFTGHKMSYLKCFGTFEKKSWIWSFSSVGKFPAWPLVLNWLSILELRRSQYGDGRNRKNLLSHISQM